MDLGAEKKLLSLKSENSVEEFVEKWCREEPTLHDRVNAIMISKKISLADLMKSSRINRNYGYNIVNGKRTNPGRDKVIALCIAAQSTLEETQETLTIAKVGILYYRRERDVRLAMALNNKVGDVLKVNLMLEEHGLEPLNI